MTFTLIVTSVSPGESEGVLTAASEAVAHIASFFA
jgi:hypothetical protein